MSKNTDTLISIDDLDLVAASDIPFDLEIENVKGVKTRIVIQVLGTESQVYKNHVNNQYNKSENKKAMFKKRNRNSNEEYVVTAEEWDEINNENIAVRVVGWSGLKEPYSKEEAKRLIAKNAFIAAQIVNASGDVGNFIKS